MQKVGVREWAVRGLDLGLDADRDVRGGINNGVFDGRSGTKPSLITFID